MLNNIFTTINMATVILVIVTGAIKGKSSTLIYPNLMAKISLMPITTILYSS